MTLIDEVSAALQALGYQHNVKIDGIQHGHRIVISKGRMEALLDVYETTGTIRTSGKESELKEKLEGIVKAYNSDPNYLQNCILATAGSQVSIADKTVSYSSCLFVLDKSKQNTLSTALQAKGLREEQEGQFVAEGATVFISDDEIVVEGVKDEVAEIQTMLTNLGARLEESAETPFKDRIPRISARWSPRIVSISEQRARDLLGRELFEFLPAHDRRAFVSSMMILETELRLLDYSPVAMPIGRTFEGFVVKILLRLGLATEVTVSNPEFRFPQVFDSKDTKLFATRESSHGGMLEGLKQRIKEYRHLRLHSQSSRGFQGGREDAIRYLNRVVADMQEYYRYFKNYFSS